MDSFWTKNPYLSHAKRSFLPLLLSGSLDNTHLLTYALRQLGEPQVYKKPTKLKQGSRSIN